MLLPENFEASASKQ